MTRIEEVKKDILFILFNYKHKKASVELFYTYASEYDRDLINKAIEELVNEKLVYMDEEKYYIKDRIKISNICHFTFNDLIHSCPLRNEVITHKDGNRTLYAWTDKEDGDLRFQCDEDATFTIFTLDGDCSSFFNFPFVKMKDIMDGFNLYKYKEDEWVPYQNLKF